MINKNIHKSLAIRNRNDIIIWSWDNPVATSEIDDENGLQEIYRPSLTRYNMCSMTYINKSSVIVLNQNQNKGIHAD